MHLLIAEDNEVNRRVAGKFISSLGHTCVMVENGVEAVRAAAAERFDAILMDVQMPLMDGIEAARLILGESTSGVPPRIIAVTANAGTADRDSCLEAGMADFLTKPLRLELLGAALDSAVAIDSARPGDDLLDREQFGAIVDPEDEECLDIFREFCLLGRQQLGELEAARGRLDWKTVAGIAHQLKGSSSTFGMLRFTAMIAEVEGAAKTGQPSFSGDVGEQLRSTFEATVAQAETALPN